jgi:tRNA threonylcarbamoyladenosine biosynthesis protein TsaE
MNLAQPFRGPHSRTVIKSDSDSRTLGIGRSLGEVVPEGSTVSLEGGLGAGKTLLARGICSGLGVKDDVLSPSFILVEEYQGRCPVLHFDLYRLEWLGEVEAIGLFDAVDGRSVVIVEWGDRIPKGAFVFDIRVVIRIMGESTREIVIEAPKAFLETMGRDME